MTETEILAYEERSLRKRGLVIDKRSPGVDPQVWIYYCHNEDYDFVFVVGVNPDLGSMFPSIEREVDRTPRS